MSDTADARAAQVTETPFDQVSKNLTDIGAMSVDEFLSSLSDALDQPHVVGLRYPDEKTGPSHEVEMNPTSASNEPSSSTAANGNAAVIKPLTRLHQTCQRRFGTTEALKFEYVEEDGANSKRCILTITRPNGATRSYTTQPVFHRKNEAKAQVAQIAVDMGALDFILTGDSGKKGPLLAPLDAPRKAPAEGAVRIPALNEKDAPIREIEECCRQWRAGLVKAHWVALHDRKIGNKHGTALRIRLSPHSQKVYSTGMTFQNAFESKRACAKLALEQGVLDFIKFGNGQTQPAVIRDDQELESSQMEVDHSPQDPSPLSLQEFYEALPRPFPEPFGDKTALEINAPAWLNVTVQSARGGKLSPGFMWFTDGGNGLFGCLLRIERTGEPCRSYIVDCVFSKRADAKAAVCLQAMSEGLGDYIRAISATIESKVTPEMRKYVTEKVYPVLAAEYAKFRPGTHPSYDFQKDKDAFGCTMRVILSTAPAMDDVRSFSVPAEYRTKADAKTAVTLAAVKQGVVELLRFRGMPVPPTYKPFPSSLEEGAASDPTGKKRREPEWNEQQKPSNHQHKKRKTNHYQQRQGDLYLDGGSETTDASRPDLHASLHRPSVGPNDNNSHKRGNDNRSWKKPHVPGSGGLESLSDAIHPMDQARSGPSYEGGSNNPSGHSNQARPAHASSQAGSSTQAPSAQSHNTASNHVGGGPASSASHSFEHPPGTSFRSGGYAAQVPSGLASYTAPQRTTSQAASTSAAGSAQPYGAYPGPSGVSEPYRDSSGVARDPQRSDAGSTSGSQSLKAASSRPASHNQEPSYQSTGRLQHGLHSDRGPGSTQRMVHPGLSSSSGPNDTGEGSSYSGQSKGSTSSRNDTRMSPRTSGRMVADVSLAAARDKAPESAPSGVRMTGNGTNNIAAAQEASGKRTMMAKPAATARSHVQALLDFCKRKNLAQPKMHNEVVPGGQPGSPDMYKVWIVMGSEKLELPVTFATIVEGEERVSKQVLNRLRSLEKGKAKTS